MEHDERDGAIERTTMRKVAWRTLPLLMLAYLVAYIDRTNISFAAVTMNADLGFSATVYGIGAAMFSISYALFEVPSNLLGDKVGPRRWLARILVTWGLLSAATSLVGNAWQFYLVRFLLGIAEAGFYPCVVLYISGWFPPEYRARAVSRFYVALPVAMIVMGGLAGPLLRLDGTLGLRGWQWLLIAEGIPSVLIGLLVFLILPDRPETAGWLAGDERAWLVRRLARDATEAAEGRVRHGWRAVLHPLVLLLGLANLLNFVPVSAVVVYAPKMLMAFNAWSVDQAGALVALCGVITAMTTIGTGMFVDSSARRYFLAYGAHLIAAALGLALLSSATRGPALVVSTGYCLFMACSQAAGLLPVTLLSRLLHPGERAAGLAMGNTISQLGNFIGPVLFGIIYDASGGYRMGLAAIAPVPLVAIAIALMAGRTAGVLGPARRGAGGEVHGLG
ncbi:MFS transporter [Novosphingobium olei]|uniref:MFS transporter n=1 Tax=Novosphingobium olei TaxID=2728851 RepID=A0A7Y0BN22_9SPHN|nr:MFS transporter [Novosphingobium olei]NML93208.1 MFS transporter [Novosphingobium olei]